MIKTPLSTVIGGAFWTPGATVISGAKLSFEIVMKKLFSNNEQGFFYDPNDLTTMFQDAAGTIPVTAAGQPVGLVLDKSGRNNHAYQTASASRPILQRNATTGAYYLAFDGADDFLKTNNIDFTATDKVSLFAGVRKLSDASTGILCELSANLNTNNGSFYLAAPSSSNAPRFGFVSKGLSAANVESPVLAAPVSATLSVFSDYVGTLIKIRSNRVLTQNTSGQGGGKLGNYPLYIGRRAGTSLPFNGHLYSLIGIGRLTTDSETIMLEKSIAKNTGVTL